MIKLNLNLFEFETGFTLEQDKDYEVRVIQQKFVGATVLELLIRNVF